MYWECRAPFEERRESCKDSPRALAGLTATGFTWWQRYIDREEIAQREAAKRARRDMEIVLKLGPMLTSDKRTQVDVAIVLLDGLASDKALDNRVVKQVKALAGERP